MTFRLPEACRGDPLALELGDQPSGGGDEARRVRGGRQGGQLRALALLCAHLFGGLEATARGGLESAVRRLGRFLGHPATLAVAPLGRAR